MNDCIQVHPDSYEDFAGMFKRAAAVGTELGAVFGIPVYTRDYVPEDMAVLTVDNRVTIIRLNEVRTTKRGMSHSVRKV